MIEEQSYATAGAQIGMATSQAQRRTLRPTPQPALNLVQRPLLVTGDAKTNPRMGKLGAIAVGAKCEQLPRYQNPRLTLRANPARIGVKTDWRVTNQIAECPRCSMSIQICAIGIKTDSHIAEFAGDKSAFCRYRHAISNIGIVRVKS